jgi:hypothetical protein
MKKISFWALFNPKKTIAILIVLHTFLAVLAFNLGVLLFAEDILLPRSLIYGSIVLYLVALLLYPIRRARNKFWKSNYVRQKILDVTIVTACLVAITINTNIEANAAWSAGEDPAGFVQTIVYKHKPTVTEKPIGGSFKSFWKNKIEQRKQRKLLKKKFRKFVKKIKNDNSGKIAGVLLLMTLGILAIAMIACMLFASEASLLGFLVLFGGWTLVLVFGIKSIRRLRGEKSKNYKPSTSNS